MCQWLVNKKNYTTNMHSISINVVPADGPTHDDVLKWKYFPRYWPFLRGIQRSPVDSHHKGQWRGALIFYLICAWTDCWANVGGVRRYCAHHDITVMTSITKSCRIFVGPLATKILPYVICMWERVNISCNEAFQGINDKNAEWK